MSRKHVKQIISDIIISECKCTDCRLYDWEENPKCKKCEELECFKPKKYILEYINEKTTDIVKAFNLR